jgi:hypothetical protein
MGRVHRRDARGDRRPDLPGPEEQRLRGRRPERPAKRRSRGHGLLLGPPGLLRHLRRRDTYRHLRLEPDHRSGVRSAPPKRTAGSPGRSTAREDAPSSSTRTKGGSRHCPPGSDPRTPNAHPGALLQRGKSLLTEGDSRPERHLSSSPFPHPLKGRGPHIRTAGSRGEPMFLATRSGPTEVRRGENRRSAYPVVRTGPAGVAEEHEKSRTVSGGG